MKLAGIADIYYSFKDGRKIAAVTLNNSYNLNYTLRELELLLPIGKFLRVHKSMVVNLGCIDEITPSVGHAYKIALKNTVSVRLMGRLRNAI